MNAYPKPAIHLISLGCAKNLVDSEVMLGALLKAGHAIVNDPSEADVIIVNTCGFIDRARKESIDAILRAGQSAGQQRKMIIAGCLAQRYARELAAEIPEASAIIGVNEVPRIHEIVAEIRGSESGRPLNRVSRRPSYLYDFRVPRLQLTPSHYAYLKIAEGCDHPCAFCSIPVIRGRYRSRTVDDVVREARALLRQGVRELLLISQDTTCYGRDLGQLDALPALLRRLDAVEGDFWIRLLYTHPAHWTPALIEAMKEHRKVCRYVDIPLQHAHDDVLKRMRRTPGLDGMRDLLRDIRAAIPEVSVRTAFIVGFPGETAAQFRTLLDFVEEQQFDHLGAFEYSREEDTPAGRMTGQIPPKIRRERLARLMALQQTISARRLASRVGQKMRVLVDGKTGRTEFQAPEVDGHVILKGCGWKTGQFANVCVKQAGVYDLVAVGDCHPAGVLSIC
ncbi:MAG: 30S ribosomal protein S12 methylthiotransferase RimO [Verrucomicrobiae bacterium]|nr:30S ribosomal protein S12 methylthiotransferase RimO [Verrucomicrobiae bacterium]